MAEKREPQFKIVFVGDSGVGKTTMINSYLYETTEKYTNPTVGTMFFTKTLSIEGTVYTLQIWDTAGQERFRAMTPLCFKDANGVIMVCDLTDKGTLMGLREWVGMIKDHAPEDVSLCIAANKADLEDQYQLQEEDIKEMADFVGCEYVYTSAWQNRGIDQAFRLLVAELHAKRKQHPEAPERDRGGTKITAAPGNPSEPSPAPGGCKC